MTFEYRYNNYISTDYGDLVDQFIKDFGSFSNLEQHEFFQQYFIDQIAEALYEFANIRSIPVSYSYCEKLAWGGLSTTTEYNKLSSSEKNNIQNALTAELISNGFHKGNDVCK